MPSAHWNYFEVMFNVFSERHFKNLTVYPHFCFALCADGILFLRFSISCCCCFFLSDGPLSLSLPPNEDRLRNKQRKELHRRRGSILG